VTGSPSRGPTGRGNTTLLQLLSALDRPTSGRLLLDGHDLTAADESRLAQIGAQHIGFVFQTFNLLPTLTARENVETALVPARIETAERRRRAGARRAGSRASRGTSPWSSSPTTAPSQPRPSASR
jgi:putative ABC transport system ATP-binding protein